MRKNIDSYFFTDEEKQETCWQPEAISGTKVNAMFIKPKQLFKEVVTGQKPYFSEKVKAKMEMGKLMEAHIIDLWNYLHPLNPITPEKHTWRMRKSNYWANIDGWDTKTKTIYEIKNTETESINELWNRYKWQAIYYCWFFQFKKIVLITFINGWKFESYEYEPTENDYQEMLNKIEEFKISVANNTWAPFIKDEQYVDETRNAAVIETETLKQLVKLNNKIKDLNEQADALKQVFIEEIGEDTTGEISDKYGNNCTISERVRKGSIDETKLKELLNGVEIPRKEATVSKVYSFKGKDKTND